jgi:PAS domain S-box-containing protein
MQNDELRRSQEQLEESRSRYVDLYENAPACYLTFDEKGLVSDLNLTAAHFLGIDRAFLLKKPFSALIAPESQDLFYLHRRNVLRSAGLQTCELMLKRHKEGKEQFFHARLESIATQADGIKTVRTILIDITERKRMEQELRDGQRLLQDIIDSSPSIIFIKDRDGKFITINAPLEKMLGMTREQLEGKTDYDIFPKDVAE